MTDFEEVLTEVNAVEQMVHQLHMGLIARLLEQREALEHKSVPAYSEQLIGNCQFLAKYKVVPKGSTVEVTSKFYETAIAVSQVMLNIMGVKLDENEDNKGGDGRSSDGTERQEGTYGFAADRANP